MIEFNAEQARKDAKERCLDNVMRDPGNADGSGLSTHELDADVCPDCLEEALVRAYARGAAKVLQMEGALQVVRNELLTVRASLAEQKVLARACGDHARAIVLGVQLSETGRLLDTVNNALEER